MCDANHVVGRKRDYLVVAASPAPIAKIGKAAGTMHSRLSRSSSPKRPVKRLVPGPKISTLAAGLTKNITVPHDNRQFIAAYESHHVAHLEEFASYDKAAAFLYGWNADVHSWPVAIYHPEDDRLWLWCGYRTLNINRENALEDARAILRLPKDHQFAVVEFMKENL
jgi:hypothetical protein